MKTVSSMIRIGIIIILSLFAGWAIFANLEQFSSFGVAIVLAAVGVGFLYIIDRFVLFTYNTLDEIQKGNIAVGLALIAYSIIIAAAILASFIVWR